MSNPAKPVSCPRHGQSHATYVCGHVVRNAGLGFVQSDQVVDPRPDAWCDACERVRQREHGWNDVSEAYAGIKIVCASCYDLAELRNRASRPLPLDEPFRCGTCDLLHHEQVLDYGFRVPEAYLAVPEAERSARAVLTGETCTIDGREWFVRGCVEVPLTDAPNRWVWGVWVSLSKQSFARYTALSGSEDAVQEPPMFGWLCSTIPAYPETFLLKTEVYLRGGGLRPYIELEPTDHPLAIEQHTGICVARARELASLLGHGL
jgi:hypothetical protein